jgi:hypothetical protein
LKIHPEWGIMTLRLVIPRGNGFLGGTYVASGVLFLRTPLRNLFEPFEFEQSRYFYTMPRARRGPKSKNGNRNNTRDTGCSIV